MEADLEQQPWQFDLGVMEDGDTYIVLCPATGVVDICSATSPAYVAQDGDEADGDY